jgi:transcriptional regulator GlxA family with amidase domain
MPQKGKRFVQSNEHLYTSGGISAGIGLSFHIVEKLLGADVAKRTVDYKSNRIMIATEMIS